MKHLLKMQDLTKEELFELLDLAAKLKAEKKAGIPHPHLAGKKLGLIFEKASTRTRVSFEVGMVELGGYPLFLSSHDLQIGRGEPIKDTARVLSRMVDGVMIRTFGQNVVEEFAEYGSIPVINGLTDYAHPCQVLADLLTIIEHKGTTEGKKFVFIGDGNNMANSLIVGCLMAGMEVAIACPEGYEPDAEILKNAQATGRFTLSHDPVAAACDADVLCTDVWASMGQEGEAEKRKQAFAGYQINDSVMAAAKEDAMVLHCLPAHREEEITEKVFEAHAAEIFDEAENRLHAQKAVLVKLMA